MPANSLNIRSIFDRALEIQSTAGRKAFLDEACAGDTRVRQQVEALLDANANAGSFLKDPVIDIELTINHESQISEQPGTVIGPYKLLQQIGEGGFGVVFMAEQIEPLERRVALKIIKPGMDTRQVIARFEAERQALAIMDHPNIARALDAGVTDTGRPYFVMELVKGKPITEYCDEHQLTPRERLELFLPVCQAIQHAHQKGIIHRDIKPSNVLVAHYDDQPVPKVIDFGVAKATHQRLTEKTMFTEFGQVLGTFEYMSPEQARLNQWDVDTRTDIYSLGVLLYELLAGATPFDRRRLRSAALDELLRIIRDEEPPRPSTRLSKSLELPAIAAYRRTEPKKLSAVIRGELDWIVMKTLEKDRSRRYATANDLRSDLQRYLDGEPVTAAPPSASYQLRKFARRHRVAVMVSLLVTSALLLAVVGTSGGMVWAIKEKNRADEQTALAMAAEREAVLARDREEYSRYVSNIQAVDSSFRDSAPNRAGWTLENTPAKHRNWEWAVLADRAWPDPTPRIDAKTRSTLASATDSQFWQSQPAKALSELRPWEAPGGLYGGVFSPDGESVYFSHARGEIKKFAIALGEARATYSSESDNSITVAISPYGTKLASFPFSNSAIVWDTDTQEVIAQGPDDLEKSSSWICSWSRDEKYLVTGHMDGTVKIWDAQSKSLPIVADWPAHQNNTLDLFIPRSNDSVWSASNDGTICQWSIPDGMPLGKYRIAVPGVEYQTISPKEKLACAVLWDGSHLLWEIETEKVVRQLSGPSDAPYSGQMRYACDFSPDETCVAVMTGKSRIAIYDVASGEVINELGGHGVPLRKVAFSPDGTMLLTVSEDGRATLWSCFADVPDDRIQAHDDVAYQMEIDSTGSNVLVGSYSSTASVWNLRNNRRQAVFEGHNAEIVAVDLHPDGRRAATLDAEGVLHVWNSKTATPLFTIESESDDFADHISGAGGGLRGNLLNFPATLSTGIFTPDGSRLVAFHKDAMKVFDAVAGRVEVVLDEASSSGWPVYSHDSSLVTIIEMNAKSAGVWDVRTGKLKHRIQHGQPLVMVDFSPVDQRLITCGMGSEIVIWDANTGERLQVLDEPAGNVMSCRFSADGKFVLAGYADGKARIWDSHSGRLFTTLVGHSQRLRDVRFNPDQTRLLTWAMDDRAIIWGLAEPFANQLLVLDGMSQLLQAHWTPDGRDIVSAWSDGHLDIWRGATQEDIRKLVPGKGTFERNYSDWRRHNMNAVVD